MNTKKFSFVIDFVEESATIINAKDVKVDIFLTRLDRFSNNPHPIPAFFTKHGEPALLALLNLVVGLIANLTGQYTKALELLEYAESCYEDDVVKGPARRQSFFTLFESTVKEILEGKPLNRSMFARAFWGGMANESSRPRSIAKSAHKAVQCQIGMYQACLRLRKYDRCFELLESAELRARQFKMSSVEIDAEMARSALFQELGLCDEAIKSSERAIQLSEKNTDWRKKIECAIRKAAVLNAAGQHREAASILTPTLNICERKRFYKQRNQCITALALAYEGSCEYMRGIDLLEVYQSRIERRGSFRDTLDCGNRKAWLFAKSNQPERALSIFMDLEQKYDASISSDQRSYFSHGMGFALRTMGRISEAAQEYEKAITAVESTRSSLLNGEHRRSFLASEHHVFREAIRLHIEHKNFEKALEYVERLKSRNLSEMLEGREPTSGWPADKFAYENVRSLVKDDCTALVEFFPMEDQTVAFIVLKEMLLSDSTVIIPDYNISDLQFDVESIGPAALPESKKAIDAVLKRLSDRIFSRIRSHLEGIKHIVFIPYAGFHLLPLHAMYTDEQGSRRYLIDNDCLVTYAPSAKVLMQTIARKRSQSGKVFIAKANPTMDLLYAQYEAQAIGSLFADSSEICRNATRGDIVEKGRTANIFHYAGHADGNSIILHSADAREAEDHYQVTDIFSELDLPVAQLATLSACETGKIKPGQTDEYIGLPSAFLHAGAATVICSLWRAPDVSATLLMSKMYDLLKQDYGKAQALRQAQLWLRNTSNMKEKRVKLRQLVPWIGESDDKRPTRSRLNPQAIKVERVLPEDLSHPYYWAGFICSGAP